jgi:hypothetical protein
LPRNWLHPGSLLALSILTILGSLLGLILLSQDSVTRHNFAKIRVGMSTAELSQLLGTPEYQANESGLVDGPEHYSTNHALSAEERRRSGIQEYRRQQWSSSELTIIAISDLQGRVVCRYAGEGRRRSWIALLRYRLTRWISD